MSKQQNKKRKLEHSSQLLTQKKASGPKNPDVIVNGRIAQVSSLSNISKHFYQP